MKLTDLLLIAAGCFCAFGLVTEAQSVAEAFDYLMKLISRL